MLYVIETEWFIDSQCLIGDFSGIVPVPVCSIAADGNLITQVMFEYDKTSLDAKIIGKMLRFAVPEVHAGLVAAWALGALLIAYTLHNELFTAPIECDDVVREDRISGFLNPPQSNPACFADPSTVGRSHRELAAIQLFWP